MTNLVARELTMEYSSGGYKVRPIDSLDLDITTGELVLLLGASGCGKTTLLSMLARLLTPTHGTIHFGDTDVTALSVHQLAEYRRHTVGIVFQAFNLIPSLTARENVQIALQSARVPRRDARDRAEAVLREVGLDDRMHHRPSDLSGGQQQRVAIARALALDPPLILADEPTAHLDYIQVDGVLRLLRELAKPGRVVVVATHDDRLLPLADHVVELTPRRRAVHAEPERIALPAGTVLFSQGDEGDVAYVIEEGEIHLVRDRAGGGEEMVARMGPNRYFGELAPLFGMRRTATARAAVDSVVTTFTPHDLRSLMVTSTAPTAPPPE